MIKCFGLFFRGLSKEFLLNFSGEIKFIVTVNSEFIVRANSDQLRLKRIINNNIATFDGQIPFLLAKSLNPKVHFEKISGSDFFYDLCGLGETESLRIFLLGGQQDSNAGAVEWVKEHYDVAVSGYSPPFEDYPFSQNNLHEVNAAIESFRPDVLMVGFGAVKQEYWIDDNLDLLKNIGVKYVIGVGGTFEFVSGKIDRAPVWVQKVCLEGVYRFLREPRLFRFKRLIKSFGVFKYWLKDVFLFDGNRCA